MSEAVRQIALDSSQPIPESTDNPPPARELRRNFILGIFNGAVFQFAETLIDPSLVLTWFVSQLTASNLLIGLVSPLAAAGWFLPQVFLSARVQRMERKMPMYVWGAVIRIIAWLVLTAVIWLVDDPLALLVGFFVLFGVARVTSGISGLPFFDIVAKIIPARRRGAYFAWRQLLGGVLALAGGWVVKVVLNAPALPFPRGHALLFLLFTTAMGLSMFAFTICREPPGTAVRKTVTLGEQLQRAGQILRQDRVYRRYIAAQISLAVASIALPFYGIYARRALGAPEWMVGVYLAVRSGALLLFNLPWGRLSDRFGNRLVLRLMSLCYGLAVLLTLGLMVSVGIFHPQGAWLPYLVLPIFFVDGMARPAGILVGNNFLLELVPEKERPLYLGLSNTLTGIVLLVTGLGGLLVDAFGLTGLFLVSLLLYLTGYLLASGLPEPREA